MTRALDWRDRRHWSAKRRPCRYCGRLTNLRDEQGRPAMKVCAEQAEADAERTR
ncbi:hypothetical protein [Streptomyces montanisoli]|uniref:Uncharacterized protein n=1 Tax=Streptomyces montanisoli TaxID=2798581 RepID=A0A940M4Z6_9ACTN|nr:hypothetical protein [Streptomyces montanisoli]MBP0456225.1 hypothetical protein [Streptomyces montanisoli]